MDRTAGHVCISRRIDRQATQSFAVDSSRRTAHDTVRVAVIRTGKAGHYDRRRGLADVEVLRIVTAVMVRVARVSGVGRRRSGVSVVVIIDRQSFTQLTCAGYIRRAGRLRRAVVSERSRVARDGCRGRSLGDRESLRVAASSVVEIAWIGVAGRRGVCSGIDVVRVIRIGRQTKIGSRDCDGTRRDGRASVSRRRRRTGHDCCRSCLSDRHCGIAFLITVISISK